VQRRAGERGALEVSKDKPDVPWETPAAKRPERLGSTGRLSVPGAAKPKAPGGPTTVEIEIGNIGRRSTPGSPRPRPPVERLSTPASPPPVRRSTPASPPPVRRSTPGTSGPRRMRAETTLTRRTSPGELAPERPEVDRDDPAYQRRRRIANNARQFLVHMDNLARQLGVHDTTNEAVKRSLRLVIHDVRAIQEDAGDLSLVFADGHAFVNGVWVRASKRVWEAGVALTERLESIGWRGMVLDRGAEAAALLRLSQLLRNADVEEGEDPGIPNVRLLPIPSAADRARAGEPSERAKSLFKEGMATLSRAELAALDLTMRRRQRALVQGLVQLAEDNPEYLLALTTIRDPSLPAAAHSLMVCIYSIALGRMLDLGRRLLLRLGVCALAHNLGEAMVRAELFHLDRNLLAHERQEVESHALQGLAHLVEHYGFGERILQRALVAAEHHLHFDGEGGYPYAAPPRHLFSRVIAVADVFDALCSARPHRAAYPPDQAVKLVWRQASRQLDPVLVRALVRVIGRYPPGSLVELDTDELAVVLGPGLGRTPLKRPRVILITDEHRRELAEPELVDLGDRYRRRRAWKRTIVRTRDPEKLGVLPASYLFAPRVEHPPEQLDCDDMSLLARADL